MADNITMQRLDQRIDWYDRHAAYNQFAYKMLRLVVIVAAALIPFLSGTEGFKPPWLVGALGVVIAVAEGFQQLNQHHVNWTNYRSTCEALKHERYLYLAKAAPYAGAADAHALLAERVESLMSQETAKWTSLQERLDKKPAGSRDAIKDG